MLPGAGRGRLCLLGPLFTWMALAFVRILQILCGHVYRFSCDPCGGLGIIDEESCVNCGGFGRRWVLDSDGMGALVELRVELLYLAGLIAFLGLIVYAFTVVECRACRTRGCKRCEGKGWLTAIDRWVTEG